MTEKNIFVYILSLPLNISDFIWFIFYVKTVKGLPEKGHSSLLQQPSLKIENQSSPSSRRGGDARYATEKMHNLELNFLVMPDC